MPSDSRLIVKINGKNIAMATAKQNKQKAVSAITALQDAKPQLTTVPNVEICATGIEYPLASGPTTFTPEDLAEAVAAQDDPGIAQPRIWIGHPDDPRIHGQRHPGGPPSGEPAIGKVTGMRLEKEGNLIVGDLEGVPLWFANIMASAYPSRSIEGNFNVETVTGKKWRLVISGLAMLGVCWPGVSTLEDIASLFTESGPEGVEIVEATSEEPVTVAAVLARNVTAEVTVEDLRRQYYESLTGDESWWWIRAFYLDPPELIVDNDEGDLFRVGYSIDGDNAVFEDPKQVKIKYVNAAGRGIQPDSDLPEAKVVLATFKDKKESRPDADDEQKHSIVVPLQASAKPKTTISFDLKRSA